MKKLFPILLIFFAFACTEEKKIDTTSKIDNPNKTSLTNDSGFEIDLSENTDLLHENMRIYPIIADDEFIQKNNTAGELKNLKEGMEIKGFRITEQKAYGNQEDYGNVNSLTLHNKTDESIYLMAGDVVKGGKQDRIIAEDMVIPPNKLMDVAVFCVEKNRWQVIEKSETEEEDKAKSNDLYAFSGYYNCASNKVRKTVKYEKNQNRVWEEVKGVTSLNNAISSTNTYTWLEESGEFTQNRDPYINFFKGKFDQSDKVVGMVVVNGNKIMGTDLFGHPTLFRKQYEALLHAYVTDIISEKNEGTIDPIKMERYFKKLALNYSRNLGGEKEKEAKFEYKNAMVHFTDL